jgi:hypothetical protein
MIVLPWVRYIYIGAPPRKPYKRGLRQGRWHKETLENASRHPR